MAPTLASSNSFLLNTTPRSRLIIKNPRFSVFAKKAGPFPPFQLGKSKDENSSNESSNGDSGNSNPFRFNFGKGAGCDIFDPSCEQPWNWAGRRSYFVATATTERERHTKGQPR
ncbi:hypothetical protein WN944_004890 [Citrus x changshan-huyou]|uniref:Uncharacterized protein n=1 Tax=Citrus x changshan-huyou TaxID=2935761 RepID=A0AAP0QGQ6_9ROSI